MIGFSIAPSSKFHSHSIDRWRRDPELRSLMPWSRLHGNYVEDAALCFQVVPLQDLWMGVTATASPLAYQNVPTSPRPLPAERRFTLLMPNVTRLVEIGGRRHLQQAGECTFTDSQAPLVGHYALPHAAICLNVPYDTVLSWLPSDEPFDGLRFGGETVSSRITSLLLLSLWRAVEREDDCAGRPITDALLDTIARRCRQEASAGERQKRISCEQVTRYIDEHLRDPKLSVQMVAARIGVTTRYLQLLFAAHGKCISEYIKRERLRGCLLDLRDSGFDDQSITEIAFSWGFNSAAHFSSSFRKEFGLCPREYRRCHVDDLLQSPLAEVDAPLVHAVQVLARPTRTRPRPFASSPREQAAAVS